MFEPFFTTKPVGSGTGLGLSITYKIIHDLHHGKIDIHTSPNGDTVFEFILPKERVP
ncbi:MAG: ATP-binding protein [Mangrovibacterium sp.]|nr:ATP-binding protein [Mangrovibacterium sp.]